MMPQSALHSSAEEGYQFGGQLPVPARAEASQSMRAVRAEKTLVAERGRLGHVRRDAPPAQPAMHSGEVVIACRSWNTDMIVHWPRSTAAGGRPPGWLCCAVAAPRRETSAAVAAAAADGLQDPRIVVVAVVNQTSSRRRRGGGSTSRWLLLCVGTQREAVCVRRQRPPQKCQRLVR